MQKLFIRSKVYSKTIKRIDSNLPLTMVRITFMDESTFEVTPDVANKTITVNGVPCIDWYARQN